MRLSTAEAKVGEIFVGLTGAMALVTPWAAHSARATALGASV